MRWTWLLVALIHVATGIEFLEPLPAAEPEYEPVARWTFDSLPAGEHAGQVQLTEAGPSSPEFTDFPDGNFALLLTPPAWMRVPDPDGKFRFQQGDAITLEAWVNIQDLQENAYIIGKGRTGNPGFAADNQNWALRLRSRGGAAGVNFLFRSQPDDSGPGHWHRWTSKVGFSPGSGWHHVAVSYRFGQPDSIRAVLDGQQVEGSWDMGGSTGRAPVVDDDEVWIGSAMNGAVSNSLHGMVDEIAVYREIVPVDVLKSRFRWNPQPVATPAIPDDAVLVQLFGPIDGTQQIPRRVGSLLTEWRQDAMGFVRLPHKYDSWGVRDDWGKTLLVRAWAEVDLEAGDYRVLARSRGLSRLWIDDQIVLTTPPQKNRGGAHHVVDPLPRVPVEGMRPHWMNDHEEFTSFRSDGGRHRFMYEVIVGGPKFRLEFGEGCVALARDDGMFCLLSPRDHYPLTDDGWFAFVDHQSEQLNQLDLRTRQSAASEQDAFWRRRHEFARANLMQADNHGTIDQLIQQRIDAANRARHAQAVSQSDALYVEQVQPLLSTHCYRCHADKEQGGLSMRSRERLLQGGESGDAAITPGRPDESYLIELVSADPDDYRMPPNGPGLSPAEVETVRQWISAGAPMPQNETRPIEVPPLVDDYTFLRRVFIDTVGVTPTVAEARAFLRNPSADRRTRLIDQLLRDPRWGDNWVGYWQDVLAENPNLLKPMLNNTGPFRWWIHEAMVDNKPMDRFATELIEMRGSAWAGGAAGFGIASQNDVPMAAKGHVIGSALLGVQMECARCHDAPYHQWTQGDLFHLAAMLERKPIELPESSTVPGAFFESQQRQPLIEVTLTPGSVVEPQWPFAEISTPVPDPLVTDAEDPRAQLAAQVTASRRFAEVIANRLWRRLMGRGLVEPVDDWEHNPPSDPRLLAALADKLIDSGYDLKELARAILNSQAYQRQAVNPDDEERYFAGPYRRRMTAEQIVDTLFHAAGQSMDTEPLTLDIEGTFRSDWFLNFGRPRRSWQFTSLANERDRPSLALPRAQAVADVLKAFGWRNSRPDPTTNRDHQPNLIQPGVLANGTLGVWLTRLTDDSELTRMMLADRSLTELVDELFLRILTRPPTDQERERFETLLAEGFDQRVVPESQWPDRSMEERFRYVSWSNHLNTEANTIKIEMEEVARRGDPPTRYLTDSWRQRAEDAVWALLNSPEMVLVP